MFCIQLMSYEILLLCPSHITVHHCLNLGEASLLSLLKNNLITASPFHPNLTETLLKDPYVTFAHGTYLRYTNGKFEQDILSQIFDNPLSSNPYLR